MADKITERAKWCTQMLAYEDGMSEHRIKQGTLTIPLCIQIAPEDRLKITSGIQTLLRGGKIQMELVEEFEGLFEETLVKFEAYRKEEMAPGTEEVMSLTRYERATVREFMHWVLLSYIQRRRDGDWHEELEAIWEEQQVT